MLTPAVLPAWAEWTTRSSLYKINNRPGIRRAYFFRIYLVMSRVREISFIISLFLIGGTPATTKTSASRTYLALGDSYTIGQSVEINDRYPMQLIQRLRAENLDYTTPDIIAVTGWTTADLLSAMPGKTPNPAYNAVSLLIGVNNQYQHLSQEEYRIQFTELLHQSIRLAGDRPSHVIILSIPDYSVTPFAKGRDTSFIAAQIDSFNIINREVAAAYHVHYIDVTGESRRAAADPSLIAPDNLHFSGKEYAIWAAMMEPVMKELH